MIFDPLLLLNHEDFNLQIPKTMLLNQESRLGLVFKGICGYLCFGGLTIFYHKATKRLKIP
jgi:hypothetical protein